jgi:YlmC/YmxH family sporulation protein
MGFITDLDLDLDTGKVKAFVIPGAKRILPIFGKTEDIVIPWNKVKKIGIDFILVELENLVEGVISE